ncbi:TonB-dependent receptor [Novosphingobium cyanobacteriorum]|uniref:TonB-dependent receptor n=1 Tax=Novosphingobium cyanobacteriorum TaxID=3024215 RepID=A0ABT6CHD1_9SPHN|nr:TonB-dependent receptor [Novosphingobium cyanobacteriorum]MDF8333339.1 TonB-dependent receptor [Novosphingobium cyanobacteriorum]
MRLAPVLLASAAVLFAQPAFAQEMAAPAADAPAADASEIVVFGNGETRQVQELSSADIAILAAGSSPLKAIEKLPSVNFQSADPFGTYEWSTRITIRGFNQNQLGFTLDGIPLGDMSYGNYNGLHISRAIISENVGSTLVSQGSGSIDTQSTNNLGGTLQFSSMDPASMLTDGHYALDVNGTAGSNNTYRGFARFAIGDANAARLMVSGVYGTTDKWKGDGRQRQWAVNAKGVVPIGDAQLEGFFSHSDRAEQDYQDLSLEMINRLGYDWDNFGPSGYATAINVADIANNRDFVNNTTGLPGPDGLGDETFLPPSNPAAGTVFPGKIASVNDSYYDASGLRRDNLASIGLTAPIGSAVTFKVKTYLHTNRGQGTWGTPFVGSPNGVPMAVRTTEYDINRKGVFGSLSADVAFNKLTIGAWYENNDLNQARRFYAYQSRTNAGRDHLKFMKNPFFTQWDIDLNTKTFQYYVEDEIKLGDATLNLGWKGFKVTNHARANVVGGRTQGDLSTKDWFQPHVGVNYKFMGGLEAFAGFTSVTRAFASATTAGPFSSSQAGFDAIKPFLKPEKSDTYEAGLRFTTGGFQGVLGGYYVDFKNRLLTIPTSIGIVGAANALQNVGSVRAQGIEASGEYKFGNGLSAFASYSYNDNKYRDNVVIRDGAGNVTATFATAGKTVVDSPRHLAHGEIAYDSDTLFGRVGVNYMSKRFFTYTNGLNNPNDGLGFVPGRALVDAAIGYRMDIGMREKVELQVNATNLFDKKYIATIGSNGFGNVGDNGTFLAGAPRQVFVTLKAGF